MEAPLGSVLVIGGCGFLGHHIVRHLCDSSDASSITVFDVQTHHNRITGPEYLSGSITSREDVLNVLNKAKPKVIFHTASPPALTGNRKIFEDVNIGGTKLLLESAQECGYTKAFIYTSSSSVIQVNHSDIINATEEAPLISKPLPEEIYSYTKAIAEKLVLDANKRGGMLTTAIRPAGLFGEGDPLTTAGVIQNAKEGKGKIQIGDGTNLFDWTYVGNNAYAQILAARILVRPQLPADDMKVDGEAFTITNDEPWPFWDFTRAIAAAAGFPVRKEEVWVLPLSVMLIFAGAAEWAFWLSTMGKKEPTLTRSRLKYSTMIRTFNIEKAKKRLGYRPQVSMHDGIDRTVSWYLDQSKKAN
jgi:sterol-4alpha-carboxylate 3-dehydrogenase (decarboxylating)